MTLRKKKHDISSKINFKEDPAKQSVANADQIVKKIKPAQFEKEPEILSASSKRLLTKQHDLLNKKPAETSQENKLKKAINIKPAVLLEFNNSKFRLNQSIENDCLIASKDEETGTDQVVKKTNSLFHPSRIAMSSTPVHTNPSESEVFRDHALEKSCSFEIEFLSRHVGPRRSIVVR
jgi:hypothetical protein